MRWCKGWWWKGSGRGTGIDKTKEVHHWETCLGEELVSRCRKAKGGRWLRKLGSCGYLRHWAEHGLISVGDQKPLKAMWQVALYGTTKHIGIRRRNNCKPETIWSKLQSFVWEIRGSRQRFALEGPLGREEERSKKRVSAEIWDQPATSMLSQSFPLNYKKRVVSPMRYGILGNVGCL